MLVYSGCALGYPATLQPGGGATPLYKPYRYVQELPSYFTAGGGATPLYKPYRYVQELPSYFTAGGGGGGLLPYISHIGMCRSESLLVCAAPKGMVFEPVWPEIRYRF